jgi:hypothetical protein
MKFALLKDNSREFITILNYCILTKSDYKIFKSHEVPDKDYIPYGTVEWTDKILKANYDVKVTPDYYPNYLSEFLHRKVWKTDDFPINKRVFIKPADSYKRFTGFVTDGTYKGKKRGPYYCSEIVKFQNEFRYYISHKEILASGWYDGEDENVPAPDISEHIDKLPNDLVCALDLGTLENNEVALIEQQHPYACGWYGEPSQGKHFVRWVIDGWEYLKSKKGE